MSAAADHGPRWLLTFDASTPIPSIGLGVVEDERDELIVSNELHGRANQASATLMARVTELAGQAGIALHELSAIGCGRGPGTFTGSRVAAAAAKGLALGLGLDVVPVSTLAALAAGLEGDGTVLALLDARRQEVYAGLFELDGARVRALAEERCAPLTEVLTTIDVDARAGLRLVGPGVDAYAEQIPEPLRARSASAAGLTAAGLWRATVSGYRDGAAIAPGALEVSYLRASYAEMGLNTPKRPLKRSPWL